MSMNNDILKILLSLKHLSDELFHRNRSSDDTNRTSCVSQDTESVGIVYLYSSLPALIFILGLALNTKRRSLLGDSFYGRPGLVVPMNILEMRKPNLAFVLAFVSTSNLILNIFRKRFNVDDRLPPWMEGPYINVAIKLIIIAIYGVVAYPLFAAISQGRVKWTGHLIGFIYALGQVGILYYIIVKRSKCLNVEGFAYVILSNLPSIVSLMTLIIYFIGSLWTYYTHRHSNLFNDNNLNTKDENEIYVRKLLKPPVIKCSSGNEWADFRQRLSDIIDLNIHGFQYTPRLLCCLSVAFVLIYGLALEVCFLFIPLINFVIRILTGFVGDDTRTIAQIFYDYTYIDVNEGDKESVDAIVDLFSLGLFYTKVVKACFLVGIYLSLSINLVHIPLIMLSHRKHMLTLAQARSSRIFPKEKLSAPSYLVLGFIRYTGYQVGYLAWGFLIQLFVFTALAIAMAVFVFIPFIYEQNPMLWNLFQNNIAWIIFAIVFYVAQIIMTKFCFTLDYGNTLSINNRGVFFIWSYFAFFYNVFLGIFTCLWRITLGVIAGIICLGRLDFSSLPGPCEEMDNGYITYLGFLYTEHYHHNCILNFFVSSIRENSCNKWSWKSCETISISHLSLNHEDVEQVSSRQHMKTDNSNAKLRWYLAYTLLNNRGLIYHRKAAIKRRTMKLTLNEKETEKSNS